MFGCFFVGLYCSALVANLCALIISPFKNMTQSSFFPVSAPRLETPPPSPCDEGVCSLSTNSSESVSVLVYLCEASAQQSFASEQALCCLSYDDYWKIYPSMPFNLINPGVETAKIRGKYYRCKNKVEYFKMQSHAMQSTITWLAFFRKDLVGNQRSGNAANGCLLVEASARLLLHSQISISWLVLNSAPSVNHFTWDWNHWASQELWGVISKPKIFMDTGFQCIYIYIYIHMCRCMSVYVCMTTCLCIYTYIYTCVFLNAR